MASTHEREIKRKLKEHGWEFLRRAKGSHDVYVHPQHGTLPVTFNKAGRALHNLYKDIERGKQTPMRGVRDLELDLEGENTSTQAPSERATAPANTADDSASVRPCLTYHTAEELAQHLNITRSGVQWRERKGTIKDGLQVRRTKASKAFRERTGSASNYMYYLEVVNAQPDQTERSAEAPHVFSDPTETLSAAEELLEEASQRNAMLHDQNAELRRQIESLEQHNSQLAQTAERLAKECTKLKKDAEEHAPPDALSTAEAYVYADVVHQLAVAKSEDVPGHLAELRRLLLIQHINRAT